jgi:hypothetical protein
MKDDGLEVSWRLKFNEATHAVTPRARRTGHSSAVK